MTGYVILSQVRTGYFIFGQFSSGNSGLDMLGQFIMFGQVRTSSVLVRLFQISSGDFILFQVRSG